MDIAFTTMMIDDETVLYFMGEGCLNLVVTMSVKVAWAEIFHDNRRKINHVEKGRVQGRRRRRLKMRWGCPAELY